MKKIAIVGGGAAGLMTAVTLLEENITAEIHLFEKNNVLGKKVAISGGGRCNVTTGITDKSILLSKYTRGEKFLIPAINNFPPEKVFEWFENKGVPLKVEKDLRVFPKFDNGKDIVSVFEKCFKNKIKTHLSQAIKVVKFKNNKFYLISDKQEYEFNILVITSGGNAYKHTGSSGDGYDFAKSLGHTITELGPSLNSFEVKEKWCKNLSGLSLEDAGLIAKLKDGKIIRVNGPFLFTHFGISGPAVFSLSSHIAFQKITNDCEFKVSLLPISNFHFDKWNELLLKMFQENSKKQILQIISDYLPKRLSEEVLILANIKKDKKASEVSKEERKKLSHLLSGSLDIALISRRPGDEFVTAGGVSLEEVNKKTMQSKINEGLYFAGEVLNIDGFTGGFNLQSAWATGRLAGISIAKKIKENNLWYLAFVIKYQG